ncbi:HET-domain-containing protein [Polyplosphaeria fusca]|uniref:HET-domain-containing protein n=1 Tax=Polyplosphaeria fusca TaxID=682080 RepID=A0A9P4QTZ2_9PLEO|nr:HET-domain-containing protein [Polyplosphaeria fusca]
MPLPKSLRRSTRRLSSSSSSQSRRKVCRLCHNLDPRGHPSSVYQTESNKGTVASLTLVLDALALHRVKAPTDGGCRFCGVLVQALDAFFEGWRGCRGRVTVDLKEKASIRVGMEGEKWKGDSVEIYAGSASRAPWPTLGTAHSIPINSGSDHTFDFARRCIQDCLTNPKHGACKLPSKSAATHPKRLLDVGRVNAPIHLIDTQGRAFQYASLSHCWGTSSILTATKSNWQKLAVNIPLEKLPPLFQDAVIITRQLGLRYIWIDSLCIIQDSTRDWETESAKMGAIYENSYVTIAATMAPDGSARCLMDRCKPVQLDYENSTRKEYAIRARKSIDHHPNVQEDEPARPTGPLVTRAWALQEHVLSTRILHYTATELLFECKTSFRCECLPMRKSYPTTPALIPKAIAKQSKYNHEVWDAWQRIVEQYSKRTLTVPGDGLPSLSGIASKVKEAMSSSYIAGLWKENLASDLLWSRIPSADAVSFAMKEYRAPTFSWASIDSPVSYYSPDEDERTAFSVTVKLLSSSISLSGLNPLGTVFGGSMMLRAPCLDAILSSQQRGASFEYTLLIKGTSAIRISHDCTLAAEKVHPDSDDPEQTIRRATPSSDMTLFKVNVLCTSIARYDGWISGLVFGRSGRVEGAWERLGTFSSGSEVFSKAEVQDVLVV